MMLLVVLGRQRPVVTPAFAPRFLFSLVCWCRRCPSAGAAAPWGWLARGGRREDERAGAGGAEEEDAEEERRGW